MTEREIHDPADESELPTSSTPDPVPAEVPEADAIEQAAPVGDQPPDEPGTIGDAPEADAIEQRTQVADADDEYRG